MSSCRLCKYFGSVGSYDSSYHCGANHVIDDKPDKDSTCIDFGDHANSDRVVLPLGEQYWYRYGNNVHKKATHLPLLDRISTTTTDILHMDCEEDSGVASIRIVFSRSPPRLYVESLARIYSYLGTAVVTTDRTNGRPIVLIRVSLNDKAKDLDNIKTKYSELATGHMFTCWRC